MARTLADLCTRVGYLLDMTIGASTDPSTTEIYAWINEASKRVAMLAKESTLPSLITQHNPSLGSGVTNENLPSDYLRFVSATLNIDGSGDDDYPCKKLTPKQASYRHTNIFYEGTQEEPVIWIEDSKFNFYPATTGAASTGKLIVKYIKLPADKASGDDPDTPECYDKALIFYAAAMAKAQEEEFQQYAIFMNNFLSIITSFS